MSDEKKAKDLIISYFFPSYADTGGFVVAKRVISNGKKVDILQNYIENINKDESLNGIVDKFIENRIVLHAPYTQIWKWDSIKPFIIEGMEKLNKISKDKNSYKSIYSRSMPRQAHYLGFEYKIEHPETKWIAEFSDPILFDIYGKKRATKLNDDNYIEKINEIIEKNTILKEKNINITLNHKKVTTEYLCELLPFLFADEIIFTNENQQKIMINKFPLEDNGNINNLKDFIIERSVINPQPTLNKDAYESFKSNYELNDEYINFAYFGLFYGTRNFEDVFYAFENLNESFKDKFKLHIFTAEKNFVKRAISNLKMEKNVIINDNIPYLEFLNLTTKFDVLIVSDANTKNYFEINPYLPSKIADYCGSGSDIWGICEEGSMLDKSEDITFKSRLGDFLSSKYIVNKIIFEKINSNYSLTKDEMDFKNFYFNLDNKINVMSNLENDEKILGSNLYEVINYLSIRNMNLNNDLNNLINQNEEKQININMLSNDIDKLNKENIDLKEKIKFLENNRNKKSLTTSKLKKFFK
ncbi:MAG: hypothetical protein K1X33_02010 [Methanobacteriaceae archaeon]|nr:hypothetical protein [Methanobacteriaceae archaeon]